MVAGCAGIKCYLQVATARWWICDYGFPRSDRDGWVVRVFGTLLIGALLLTGCHSSEKPVHVTGQAAGGRYQVTIDDPDGITADALKAHIAKLSADAAKPLYADDLAAFNQAPAGEWVPVSPRLAALVREALKVGRATGGAVDITDGSIRAAWGIVGTARPTRVPTTGVLDRAREHSGLGLVDVRDDSAALRKHQSDVRLALAGLGRSDAVDRIAAALDDMGADRYLVSLQGILVAHGRKASGKPWQVGLERPAGDGRQIDGIVGLDDAAMATAGDSRRFVDIGDYRVSPEFDPRTGRPVSHAGLSVSVVADSAVRADLLARALLVMGPTVGLRYAKAHHIAAFFFSAAGHGQVQAEHSPSFAPVLDDS